MPENIIHISLNSSFSFDECLWFLDRNFDDCLHAISPNNIRKALLINKKPLLVNICQKSDQLHVEILTGTYRQEDSLALRKYIIEWFDLDRDLTGFYQLLNSSEKLGYMTSSFNGLRMVAIPDLFEALCWSIIGQQINLTFAYKLKRKLVEKYGSQIEFENKVYFMFPSYEILANASIEALKAMQFSKGKADYIIGLAQIFMRKEMSKTMLEELTDFETRQKALTKIKGIGVWTANYALMKCLKEQSAIPFGDAGLIQALLLHSMIENRKDPQEIEAVFRNFSGWESYLVFYLWRSLSRK